MIDNPIVLLLNSTTLGAQDGPGVEVKGARSYGIQTILTGSPTFSLTVQGSNDGVNWVDLSAAITTGTITYVVDKPVAALRAHVTAWTGASTGIKVLVSCAE